jgi:hypothetical protein
MTIGRTAVLVLALAALPLAAQKVQKVPAGLVTEKAPQFAEEVEQPDAGQTRDKLQQLLDRYPPTLRTVFKEDPTLLTQEQYLAPYPALVNFLAAHPEVALNPTFYLDGLSTSNRNDR